MTAEEIISGESLNVVFTKSLPDNNEKILKPIVAFANSAGGKLIIGVEDETKKLSVSIPPKFFRCWIESPMLFPIRLSRKSRRIFLSARLKERASLSSKCFPVRHARII